MADNYLERKMEEHRMQGLRPARRAVCPNGNRPGILAVKYPPLNVFVTGGASGIGRAVVKAFADAGCHVAFCDIDRAAGSRTAQATGSRFYPADVADAQALDAAMCDYAALHGGIDVVVNNAAITGFCPLTDCDPAHFDRVMAVNVRPLIVTARRMLAICERSDVPCQRSIINIASTRAAMSEPGTEAYSASKGAVVSLTHALMASLAPYGVTVNCISPGWIDTAGDDISPADHEFHPSGRVGVAADIASLCVYLASPDARFINGENITVDGGVTRKMIYP